MGEHKHSMTVREMREVNRHHLRPSRLIAVQMHDNVHQAINLMQVYGVSQLPVLEDERMIGSLDERTLMYRLLEAAHCLWGSVYNYMLPPLPSLEEEAAVEDLYRLLKAGAAAVIVTRAGAPVGIVTPADVVALKVYGIPRDYEI
ncbi:MAG: CBS domain-containing protein [Kiritimatiellaeota bacterium]|nr:CBS domain-containing protein [Kiritimatiellota bacterium]